MKTVLTFLLSFICLGLVAQVGTGEPYPSQQYGLQSIVSSHLTLPATTEARVDEINAYHAKYGGPDPFADLHDIDINPYRLGHWTALPNGDRIWRYRIHAEDALATIVYFDHFALPLGGKLFAYTPDGKKVVGAFTAESNNEDRGFATEIMQGEDVVVEYYEPASARGSVPFHIDAVASAYKATPLTPDPNDPEFGDSDPACLVNVNCSPEGNSWQDEKRGVGMLAVPSFGGGFSGFCSGSLVNNTAEDCTPLFLSAFHCVNSTTNFSQIIYVFDWEASGCSNPFSSPSSITVTGSTRIADSDDGGGSTGSDFLLVELNNSSFDNAVLAGASQSPPYVFYFNGWDASGAGSSSGVGIHHPSGDIKKISTYNGALASTSWGGTVANTHWGLFWSSTTNGHSVTEGGSSGSALFNGAGRIVGTLTGGASSCTDLTSPDFYGKMSFHWNSNGSASDERVDIWLDPVGNGSTTTLDGVAHPCSTTPTLDAGIDSIQEPFGALCDGSVDPVVSIRNFGNVTLTSATIQFRLNGGTWQSTSWTGSLSSGQREFVTLPTITAPGGNNTFESRTINPNGGTDANSANDMDNVTFDVVAAQALPLQEGFEATTFPPANFTVSNPNVGTVTFDRTTAFPGGFGSSSASIFMDHFDYDMVGQQDVLLTDFYDLSTASNPYLTFDYAYTFFQGTAQTFTDTLVVGFTDDCGENFFFFFYEGGDSLATVPPQATEYSPSPGDWEKVAFPLSGIPNLSSVQFFFLTINGFGNTLALDNINIFDSIPNTVIPPVADFTSSTNTICAGESITFSDLSTNNPDSWSWSFSGGTPSSSGARNPSVVFNAPGTYNVTLTASNSAGSDTETKSAFITVNENPIIGTPIIMEPLCNGGSDGSVDIQASGGTGSYTFSLGGTSQSTGLYSGLGVGNYSYSVTDGNGCTSVSSAMVNQPSAIMATLNATQSTCNACDGSITVTASGGTGALSYSLDDVTYQSSNVFNGLCADNYTVFIQDANGCKITRTVSVTSATTPLSVSIVVSDETCGSSNGQLTASASGGTGPYSYQWTGGPATDVFSGLSTGNYTVVATDANGCTGSESAFVDDVAVPFTVNTSSTSSSCTAATGTVSASVGGSTSGFSFVWNTGDTGPNQSGYAGGVYQVTVTNNSTGCSEVASVNVNELNAPVLSVGKQDVTCEGRCDGQAWVTATGGTGTLTYTWDDPAATMADTAKNLCPGGYTVEVTDAAGCSAFDNIAITEPAAISLSASGTNVSCFGGNDGTLSASATGGNGGFTYTWDNGLTGASVSGISADTVVVTATDVQGCAESATVIVSESDSIEFTFSVDTSNAGIMVSASGGNGNFDYDWSNGQSGNSLTGLANGTYTVTATDTVGCVNSVAITLNITDVSDLEWVNHLSVYPNPMQNESFSVAIHLDKPQNIELVVYDLLGKQLERKVVRASEETIVPFQANNWSGGVYFLRVSDGVNETSIRLTKSK